MPQASIKAQAIRLLSRREYARRELEQRLLAKGAPREEVNATLDALVAEGLLSDTRYAHSVVRQKAKGYSRQSIAWSLKHKGVDSDIAREALQAAGGEDDLTRARALWARRFGTPPVDERDKARQVRFLVSRGFSFELALRLLREAALPQDQ